MIQDIAEAIVEMPAEELQVLADLINQLLKDKRAELDDLASAAGRDPASIEISVYGQEPDPDLIHALLAAGAARVVVRPKHVETEVEMGAQLEQIAKTVL